MNEKGTKRREWIKTFAIIFLVILLILTFFSNTIMNYSLPEVAAQYVQSGNINAQIRGYGTIESGDPYDVKIDGVRKVESIEVRVGDKVEKGQVLCLLSAEDSKPLEDAKMALEEAEANFEEALLTGKVDSNIMNNAGSTDSVQNYKAKIISIQNEITTAETEKETADAKVKEWEDKVQAVTSQISITSSTIVDTTNETKAVNDAKTIKDNAEFALNEANNELEAINAKITYEETKMEYESVSSGDSLDDLKQQKLVAIKNKNDLEASYKTALLNYDKAVKVLEDKKSNSNVEGSVASLERQKALLELELKNAEKISKEKEEYIKVKNDELSELVTNITDERILGGLYDKIIEARAEVKRLEDLIDGNEVVAPISGTIIEVKIKSGNDTEEGMPLFTMQREGEGYTLSFTVTNEQAKKLSVGDVAEPVNSWRYDDMQIVLSSIRPDTSNPGQNKLLTFNVTGENIVPNQSMNVSVAQRSGGMYDMVVPNSAIREDNNGKFVLIVEAKSSPIGTRYIANRVDVDVIASDDTQSAITGALYGYEFVITTSTKPVEAGQYVRMPE